MSPTDFSSWLTLSDKPALVMGILNVTPDSFSDGGKYLDPKHAIEQAERMIDDGVDLIDIGGESTRPGAQRIIATEQIRRVVPVISQLAKKQIAMSIDTTLSQAAEAALDAGASIINDISACTEDPAMIDIVKRRQCPVILMHMQGNPATMQINPQYNNVVMEVKHYLLQRAELMHSAGIDPSKIILDPGIGFGKTLEHNLQLLRELDQLTELPYPVLVGTSRKGFIAKILDLEPSEDRTFGTAATVAWAVSKGAIILRVHDVREMKQVVKITENIIRPNNQGSET